MASFYFHRVPGMTGNEATTAPDSLYLLGNPGVATPVDYDESELTLKFGALIQIDGLPVGIR